MHLHATAHAPLDNASLSFDGLLSPWQHAHTAHAGAILLLNRHGRMHPVMASPLFEVPSAEHLTTDCPRADHIPMPLREGPLIAISVDCSGPLPVTPRGNSYILLVADRYSHRPSVGPRAR